MNAAGPRITRDLVGAPLQVGEVTLVPSIRARGWSLGAGAAAGGAAGWTVRVTPGPVVVRAADGQESTLELDTTTGTTLRALAGIGVVVAILCTLIVVAVRRR